MKAIFQACVYFLFFIAAGAQQVTDSLTQAGFLYPKFINGAVLLKNRSVEHALLNYNANNQSVNYLQNGQNMQLTNVEDVDTVYIDSSLFLPVSGKFYELAAQTQSGALLLVSYSSRPHPLSASVSHNGTSMESNNEVSNNVSNFYINRRYKRNFAMNFEKDYWLKIKGAVYKVNSEKQVRKAFPAKSDKVHQFVGEQKTNFENVEDIVSLLEFCCNE